MAENDKVGGAFLRSVLLLSDTEDARNDLEKAGHLKTYAEIRGKTENEIKNHVDANGSNLLSENNLHFDLE